MSVQDVKSLSHRSRKRIREAKKRARPGKKISGIIELLFICWFWDVYSTRKVPPSKSYVWDGYMYSRLL